jgi:hypothetical protein
LSANKKQSGYFLFARDPLRIANSRQLLSQAIARAVATQDAESTQCVSAACPGDSGERPAPVLVAALDHDFDGFTDVAPQ